MKYFTTFFVIYFIVNPIIGQQHFSDYKPVMYEGSMEKTFAADMDNDGDLDATGIIDGFLYWFENMDSSLIFSEKKVIAEGIDAADYAVFDIDSDSDLDIVYTDFDNLYIIRNNGSCIFNNPEILFFTDYFNQMYPADIDNDNDIDLIIRQSGNNLYRLKNNGDGTFDSFIISTEISSLNDLVTGDIDGDGDSDIVTSLGGKIVWFENTTGTGIFGPEQIIDVAGSTESVDVYDVDSDGDNDVIAVADENVCIYYNPDGTGNFNSPVILGGIEGNICQAKVADMDIDGDMDIVVSHDVDGFISWFERDNLTGMFLMEDTLLNVTCTKLSFSDINNDSRPDIYFYNKWYCDDGSLTFPVCIYAHYRNTCNWFAAGNFDTDENIEIAGCSSGEVFYLDNYKSTFFLADQFECNNPESFITSDLNNDNFQDLIVVKDGIVYYLYDSETGEYGPIQMLPFLQINPKNALLSFDVDQDGDNDIVAASLVEGQLVWFENEIGISSFNSVHLIDDEIIIESIKVKDLDGDGKKDIVASSDMKIVWYKNNGAGNFLSPQIIDNNSGSRENIFIADLNGDNKPDVISLEYSVLRWYKNLIGSVTPWTAYGIPSTFTNGLDVCSFDAENDGDNDVFLICSGSNDIFWYKNTDYDGTFSSGILISDELYFSTLITGVDFDLDGDVDLLSGNNNNICVFYNRIPDITEQPENVFTCPFSDALFSIGTKDMDSLRWQMNNGSGFANIYESSSFQGTNTETLKIVAPDYSMNGFKFRCVTYNDVNQEFSDSVFLFVTDEFLFSEDLPVLYSECSINVTEIPFAINCSGTDTIWGVTSDTLYYDIQGEYSVDWEFENSSGEIYIYPQTIILNDVTPPVPVVAELPLINAECGIIIEDLPGATDNCDGIISATTGDPLEYHEDGYYLIHWAFTDDQGNQSYQTQPVILSDNTFPIPVIETLPELTISCGQSISFPQATDNCYDTITGTTNDPIEYFIEGTYLITWYFNDDNGNISSQTQTINVFDTITPQIICPENQKIFVDVSDSVYIVPGFEFDPLSLIENCTVETLSNSYNGLSSLVCSEFPAIDTIITVVWTVTDMAGNQSECSFEVEVIAENSVTETYNPKIKVFPNPTNGLVYIKCEKSKIKAVTCFDVAGNILLCITRFNGGDSIDISSLSEGIYILEIVTETETVFIKVAKN